MSIIVPKPARSLLETMLNRHLATAPDAVLRLAKLDGRRIAIVFNELPLTLYLVVDGARVKVKGALEREPDTVIRGTALALMQNAAPGARGLAEGITISGDADTGQAFSRLLRSAQIDWEEYLARALGDLPARKLGNVLRAAGGYARRTADTLGIDFAEYLQYETRMLAPRREVDGFLDAVDTLVSDVDRLGARLDRLEAKHPAGR
jgi:ubiquinone biosynthesis protein UbiJ